MTPELVLMAISLLGIIALLVHKHYELNRGVETRALGMRLKADPILHNLHHTTGEIFSYVTWHNFVLLLNYAFVHTVRFFMDLSHRAHHVSAGIVEKASKRTEDLSKGGAASFYLKQIKDAKDSASNGQTF